MEHLKEGIGLRGYGQLNPLQEYQKEGFEIFEEMVRRFEADVVEKAMSVQVQVQSAPVQLAAEGAADGSAMAGFEQRQRRTQPTRIRLTHGAAPEEPRQKVETVRREGTKVGRNAPCPCGSGKKYKKCHGAA
jgi:preprotein translocase subunit SecA